MLDFSHFLPNKYAAIYLRFRTSHILLVSYHILSSPEVVSIFSPQKILPVYHCGWIYLLANGTEADFHLCLNNILAAMFVDSGTSYLKVIPPDGGLTNAFQVKFEPHLLRHSHKLP